MSSSSLDFLTEFSYPFCMTTAIRTLRCRIKDKHAKVLAAMARDVNLVWNYCNELSHKVWDRERRFIGAVEMQKYLTGATAEGIMLHSQTVQAIAQEYVTRRIQFRKTRLSWRKSHGTHRSLGWIPFKASAIAYKSGQIRYGKVFLSLWDSYGLRAYKLGPGSFSEDARGRWYMNVTVEKIVLSEPVPAPQDIVSGMLPSVGIDLGLKDFATMSDGSAVEAQRFYRDLEPKLAEAQRAHKKTRVRAIHAKIANRRKDFCHKLSRALVQKNAAIFVGDVSAPDILKKDRMAKSVLDAGWSAFRTMVLYKSADAGIWFEEVDEAYSTQDCHVCRSRTGPKGRGDLGIREWTCGVCGTIHRRDVNAAMNILAAGHRRLAEGIHGC